MSKILLTLFFSVALSCLNSIHAQSPAPEAVERKKSENNLKHIVGTWKSKETSVRIRFFYDEFGDLQMYAWDDSDGEEMEIISLKIKGDQVIATERMPSTNYQTKNSYRMKNKNTLVNTLVTDNEEQEKVIITFTRVE